MPIRSVGAVCARRGCPRPVWRGELCQACWRLARMFGKEPQMFAYQPLDGYRARDDAVTLPWERLEREATARGVGLADRIAEGRPRE